MKPVTIEDIKKDIAGYRERIRTAQNKLDSLGRDFIPHHMYKKREAEKRLYVEEIRHCEKLKSFAEEALLDG